MPGIDIEFQPNKVKRTLLQLLTSVKDLGEVPHLWMDVMGHILRTAFVFLCTLMIQCWLMTRITGANL